MVAGGDAGDVGRVDEFCGSNGDAAYFDVGRAGVNTRATITFAVVNCVWPFGKPGGIA